MLSLSLLIMLDQNRFIEGLSYGDIRVIGIYRSDTVSGRLEVYYNDQWGTVCDDGFSNINAQVACKQLFNRPATGKTLADLSPGTGTIWLDNVACNGTESKLSNCSHPGWGTHNCGHIEDVSIFCSAEHPVNGNWDCWSEWTKCNVTYGLEAQYRNRICNNNSGNYCIGKSSEHLPCNIISRRPACERYSVLQVAGIAVGSTAAAAICIISIVVCFYNKSIGSRKEQKQVLRNKSQNDYNIKDLEVNEEKPQETRQDDVYENTKEELYEIVE